MTPSLPFSWRSHLSEERLFECYLAERSTEGVDPRAADHLADCASCREQYLDLVSLMDETFAAANRETAAVFTPDKLRAQKEEIARRLELLDHPGRIITFRAHPDLAEEAYQTRTPSAPSAMTSRIVAGWMAAAAAVGLFVGAGASFLYESRVHVSPVAATAPLVEAAPQDTTPRVDATALTEAEDDTRLMSEVEAAHERPRTQELLAIDTMTPHVREISYRIP